MLLKQATPKAARPSRLLSSKEPADLEALSHVNGGQARPDAVAGFEGYEFRIYDTSSKSSSGRVAIS